MNVSSKIKDTFVYNHKRNDTGEIFYVGIGDKYRSYSKFGRNKHWHNIVNKCGYSIEITHENLCWEEACKIEIYLIAFYGRNDLGLGNLVNMTDGGDGVKGRKCTLESINKTASYHKGRKRSMETCINISNSKLGHKMSLQSIENNRKCHCKYLYHVKDSKGDIFVIESIRKFCKENKLLHSRLSYSLVGKTKDGETVNHVGGYKILSREKINN
jgi:hypothetical protein